ncbi:MAG: hypothetical protein GWP17_00130 [Aquificales bacterium]|nr:hypothetical protein [Aquificales bacterium]
MGYGDSGVGSSVEVAVDVLVLVLTAVGVSVGQGVSVIVTVTPECATAVAVAVAEAGGGVTSIVGGIKGADDVSPPVSVPGSQPASPTVNSSTSTNKPADGSLPPFFFRRQCKISIGIISSPAGLVNAEAAKRFSASLLTERNCPVFGS